MRSTPEHISELLKDWAAAQRDAGPHKEVDIPQELKDYLEHEKSIIEHAEANGCVIG